MTQLTTGEILSLERRSNMTDDEAIRFARAIIAAYEAKQREGCEQAGDAVYAAWHGAGIDIAGGNWARFYGMLPPLYTHPSEDALDAARHLEFLIKEQAILETTLGPRYRVYWVEHRMWQAKWFATPGEAIDAAIAKESAK